MEKIAGRAQLADPEHREVKGLWTLFHLGEFPIISLQRAHRSATIQNNETMRYLLKQKLFALGDDFHIQDETGRNAFFVDGRAFSFGDKLSFQDLDGHELVFIRQKLLSFGPAYELYRNGELAAVVKKSHFTLFRCKFSIDVPGPDDLGARGDFLDREYYFERGDREVARVSKRWFSFTDTYGVDIAGGEDDVLILASTVVIDMICHNEEKEH